VPPKTFAYRVGKQIWLVPEDLATAYFTAAVSWINEVAYDPAKSPAILTDEMMRAFELVASTDIHVIET
jgi:hypothetical protein